MKQQTDHSSEFITQLKTDTSSSSLLHFPFWKKKTANKLKGQRNGLCVSNKLEIEKP